MSAANTMTDPISSSSSERLALPQLHRLQAHDLPTDWSWVGPDALASLNTAVPLTSAQQIPAALARPHVQVWGVLMGGQLQAVYVCSDHAQHHVTRIAYAALPQASGLGCLRHTFSQLTDKLLSAGAPKLTVHLLASSMRHVWPLFHLNQRFIVEGRLRQEWQPALGRHEDVFILSALAHEGTPAPGSLWLNASAQAAGHRFFSDWATPPPVTPLSKDPARGSTFVDTADYRLRTLTAKDANDTLVHWLNSPQLMGSMNLPLFTFSLPSVRALLASYDRNLNQFIGVFKQASDELIGFYTVLVNEQAQHAHLALCIYPGEAAASRTMVDTIAPLTKNYFERFPIQKITGSVLVSNRRMMLGLLYNDTFLLEAVLRQECVGEQGRLDVMVFSMFRDPALHPALGELVPPLVTSAPM